LSYAQDPHFWRFDVALLESGRFNDIQKNDRGLYKPFRIWDVTFSSSARVLLRAFERLLANPMGFLS